MIVNPVSSNPDDYLKDPVLWVSLAKLLSENEDNEAPQELVDYLDGLNRPVIHNKQACRKEFWAMLASPLRHRGINWLDEHGLLEELIPSWGGNPVRKSLRKAAFKQLHLEAWKKGLSESSFNAICTVHDVVVDRRLNRWALTALGTLLAGGDTEHQRSWSLHVRQDLHELGATEAELVWIDRVVRDFNPSVLFLQGHNEGYEIRPETAVAGLSTMMVSEPENIKEAVKRVDAALNKPSQSAG